MAVGKVVISTALDNTKLIADGKKLPAVINKITKSIRGAFAKDVGAPVNTKAMDAATQKIRETEIASEAVKEKMAEIKRASEAGGEATSAAFEKAKQKVADTQAQLAALVAKTDEYAEGKRADFIPDGLDEGHADQVLEGLLAQDAAYQKLLAQADALEQKLAQQKAAMASAKEEAVRAAQEPTAEYKRLENQLDSLNVDLAQYKSRLQAATDAAREQTHVENKKTAVMTGAGAALGRSGTMLGKFVKRILSLGASAFIFNVLSAAFRKIQQAASAYLGAATKSSNAFGAAMARLRGAAATLFAPIVNAIVPALTVIVNALATAVAWLAKFISLLTGKTVAASAAAGKALSNQAAGFGGAGGAAKDAAKDVEEYKDATLGIDELNLIDKPDTSTPGGGGGGGGGGGAAGPGYDFGWMDDAIDKTSLMGRAMEALAIIVDSLRQGFVYFYEVALKPFVEKAKEVGAVIGEWIVSKLEAMAQWMQENQDKVNEFIAIMGQFAMIAGIVLGVWGAFNLLTTVVGALVKFFSHGVGLAIAIAAALAAINVAAGNGSAAIDALNGVLQGFLTFVQGVFSGNWAMAWEGVKTVFWGVYDFLIITLDSLRTLVGNAFDAILRKLQNWGVPFESGLYDIIKGVRDIITGLIDFVTGVVTLKWEKAWNGIKDILHGVCEIIIGIVRGLVEGLNLLIQTCLDWLYQKVTSWGTDLGAAIGRIIDGVRQIFQGLTDFIMGVFTLDWQRAWQGIQTFFDGIWTAIVGILTTELEAMKLLINNAFTWISQKLEAWGGPFGAAFSRIVDGLRQILVGLIDFVTGIFTGNWQRAWNGVKQIFSGVWQTFKGIVQGAVNGVIGIINRFISGAVSGFNAVIGALNSVSVTVPDWVPIYGGRHFGISLPTVSAPQIPYLAQGAVIPPNKEFLAVLGDQTSGTNIEAPLQTIKQALAEVLAQQGEGDVTIPMTVYLDGQKIFENQQQVKRRRGQQIISNAAFV